MDINIGEKIRSLRQKNNLTQKELADRCELSKGFISQLESNQTSPSLSTLEDILTTLGSSFHEFFSDEQGDNPVCRKEDVFIKESGDGVSITAALETLLRTTGVGGRILEPVFKIIDSVYDIALASGIQIIIFISGLHTLPCHSRDDRLTLHFKRYCFQAYQFKRQMAYYANGMKVYGISEKDFGKVEIAYPERKEQQAIADVLDAASLNIELLETEASKLKEKKKALMQLLLTGLVRVNA